MTAKATLLTRTFPFTWTRQRVILPQPPFNKWLRELDAANRQPYKNLCHEFARQPILNNY
jgi:hypothetical protein